METMSRKIVQRYINAKIDDAIGIINKQFDTEGQYVGRFRTCSAWLYETRDYVCLMSYNTIVAAVDKNTGMGYDFLRKVYGYTSTSAQHITKFFNEYASHYIRYYPIKGKQRGLKPSLFCVALERVIIPSNVCLEEKPISHSLATYVTAWRVK